MADLVRGPRSASVPTIRVARRCDPARRQTCCRSCALASQCPPGRGARSADGGFSHPAMYRGKRPATMASARAAERRERSESRRIVAGFAGGTLRLDENIYLECLEWPRCWRISMPRRARLRRGDGLAFASNRGRRRTIAAMVKLVRFLFVCAVVLAIAGCGFVGVTIWYFGRDLPDYQQLAHYQPPIMTRVHAGDGRLLAEYATERRVFVPIQAIPKRVIDAFLSAEDKNFYSHHGIDPVSILRAAITDVGRLRAQPAPGRRLDDHPAGRQEHAADERDFDRAQDQGNPARDPHRGGAAEGPHSRTLSQRDLSRLRRLRRRVRGADLFRQIARRADARRGRLSRRPAEGAQPLQPETRFPQAAQGPPRLGPRPHGRGRRGDPSGSSRRPKRSRSSCAAAQEAEQVKAPYFAEEVRRELLARYGDKVLYGAGLSVRTSLDERLQAAADKALRDGLIAYERSHGGWRGRGRPGSIPKGDWAAHLAEGAGARRSHAMSAGGWRW